MEAIRMPFDAGKCLCTLGTMYKVFHNRQYCTLAELKESRQDASASWAVRDLEGAMYVFDIQIY